MITLKNLSDRLSAMKAIDKGDASGTIEGYASVYGSVDSVDDTIVPGAYDKALQSGRMPAMYYNHDREGVPIGTWTEWSTDAKGLYVKGRLNLELPLARDVYSAMRFGSLKGLSVALLLDAGDCECRDDGIRVIKGVQRVPEISIVGCPAEAKAEVTAFKSLEGASTVRDLEMVLRDLGLSRKDALLFISRAKGVFSSQSDSGEERMLSEVSERMRRLASIKFN